MLVKQCVCQKSTFALTTRSAAKQQGRQFVSIVRNYLVYCDAKLLPPCNTGKQSVKSKTNVFTFVHYKNCTRHSYTYIITSPPKRGLTPPSLTVDASRSNFCVVGQMYAHSLSSTVSFTLCRYYNPKKMMINVPNLKSKVSA